MVSLESVPRSIDAPSSPRISFSAEFLDENNFISISPNPEYERDNEENKEGAAEKGGAKNNNNNAADFEFLSNNARKLLPFWQMQHLEKLSKINLKAKEGEVEEEDDDEDEELEEEVVVLNNNSCSSNKEESSRVNWFVDDDPSPRPPKCTVLWKELLRLKKQRASSSLSPSSSSSSSSSSASSLGDVAAKEGKEQGSSSRNNNNNHKEQHVKRIKKGLERTRSATIRIRPMINVPICTQVKSSALPPLFPLKKGRLER
ncbi:hypothetical protein PIB30_015043 [Stylosanthes scabra]|uniref:Uncharacterized protein n=1 Tax=Stylosanthes scabra TaxID=79078 RepID=A0ABU6Z7B8_9FABA|nr:hypothetical protein [Stylosanthes scabra]